VTQAAEQATAFTREPDAYLIRRRQSRGPSPGGALELDGHEVTIVHDGPELSRHCAQADRETPLDYEPVRTSSNGYEVARRY